MESLAYGLYRITEKIARLAYVNMLWVLFTLLGLGVFGLLPATSAMFAVIRKWQMGEEDVPVYKTFWHYYRKDFLKVNLLGHILLITGYILSIEYQILRSVDATVYYIASFGVIAQLILYVIVLIYFFPVFAHFRLKSGDYFKWPFVIGISHPIMTVFLVASVVVLQFAAYKFMPALLLFFGPSITASILMWGSTQTFSQVKIAEA